MAQRNDAYDAGDSWAGTAGVWSLCYSCHAFASPHASPLVRSVVSLAARRWQQQIVSMMLDGGDAGPVYGRAWRSSWWSMVDANNTRRHSSQPRSNPQFQSSQGRMDRGPNKPPPVFIYGQQTKSVFHQCKTDIDEVYSLCSMWKRRNDCIVRHCIHFHCNITISLF
ncbi:hypothetical protein BD779DRAFT_1508328 [Infundibulicybe gibba]|nr:hypothetical protein BD779DRAFT_1508328 [Infundibulicybe gibba]